MDWQSLGFELYANGIEAIEYAKLMAGDLAVDPSCPICWLIEDIREVLYDLKIAVMEDLSMDALRHIDEATRFIGDLYICLEEFES
jgi:hypothetical protein